MLKLLWRRLILYYNLVLKSFSLKVGGARLTLLLSYLATTTNYAKLEAWR